MTQTTPPITGQAVRITTSRVPWVPGFTLVTIVHFLGVPVPTAEVYAVTRTGVATSIGKSNLKTRDDSASSEAFEDGTARLWVSEMDEGAGGATCHVEYYDFPNAVPPMPPPASGTVDVWARQQIAAHERRLDAGAAGLTG